MSVMREEGAHPERVSLPGPYFHSASGANAFYPALRQIVQMRQRIWCAATSHHRPNFCTFVLNSIKAIKIQLDRKSGTRIASCFMQIAERPQTVTRTEGK